MGESKKSINLQLPAEMYDQLKMICNYRGKSLTEFLKKMIEKSLKSEENAKLLLLLKQKNAEIEKELTSPPKKRQGRKKAGVKNGDEKET